MGGDGFGSMLLLLNGNLLVASLLFVIDTQVAVLANALCVQSTVFVLTLCCQLCASFGMITIFAHSVGIVLFSTVTALRDKLSMLLEDCIDFLDLAFLRILFCTLGLLSLN